MKYPKNIFGKNFYVSIKIVILFITIFFIHSSQQVTSECKEERRAKKSSESSKSFGKTSNSELFLVVLP